MKAVILLLSLIGFAAIAVPAGGYKHKSEAEIKALTPSQRVDEWVNEQVHHRHDVLDRQQDLIRKYIMPDGVKALPRLTEIINEYDPTHSSGRSGRKGERFDASWLMLGYIDDYAVRLRSSNEGRQAIDALEQAVGRMRAAGYGQPEQHDWKRHGSFHLALLTLNRAREINNKDNNIKNTFRFEYKIILSNAELLELSNFLTTNYPDYPSWSETKMVRENIQSDGVTKSVQIDVLKKPERFYDAYLEFKKTKSSALVSSRP